MQYSSLKSLGRNSFLAGIDLRCFKTYFKTKISNPNFFPAKFSFSENKSFVGQMIDKMETQNVFFVFLVRIDSKCFKAYFEVKISNSKLFPSKLFPTISSFSAKMAMNFVAEFLLVQSDSKCY